VHDLVDESTCLPDFSSHSARRALAGSSPFFFPAPMGGPPFRRPPSTAPRRDMQAVTDEPPVGGDSRTTARPSRPQIEKAPHRGLTIKLRMNFSYVSIKQQSIRGQLECCRVSAGVSSNIPEKVHRGLLEPCPRQNLRPRNRVETRAWLGGKAYILRGPGPGPRRLGAAASVRDPGRPLPAGGRRGTPGLFACTFLSLGSRRCRIDKPRHRLTGVPGAFFCGIILRQPRSGAVPAPCFRPSRFGFTHPPTKRPTPLTTTTCGNAPFPGLCSADPRGRGTGEFKKCPGPRCPPLRSETSAIAAWGGST